MAQIKKKITKNEKDNKRLDKTVELIAETADEKIQ